MVQTAVTLRKGASRATAAAAQMYDAVAPSAAEPARFPLNPAVTAGLLQRLFQKINKVISRRCA